MNAHTHTHAETHATHTLNQNNVFPLEDKIHGMKGKETVFLHPVNHDGFIRAMEGKG